MHLTCMSTSGTTGPPAEMSPIRVLFAHTDAFWGGDKAQMVELAAALDPRRFEPLVVTTGRGALTDECAARGIPTLVLPYSHFRRNRGTVDYLLLAPIALRRLARSQRIGLVHAHCDYSTIPLERMARSAGIPFVQHVHDMDRGWTTRKKLPVLGRADAVVAISESVGAWLRDRSVPEDRVRILYNGIHLAPFQDRSGRDAMRASLGLTPGDIALGVFARLEPSRKGQDDIVRAIALAGASRPVQLFLVGGDDRPDREHELGIRGLIAELGVADRVHLLGYRQDVPQLMAAMDLLGAPFHREGFGRVVIEGMAAGLPVVGFHSGALPELVREGVEGFLVEDGNTFALCAAMIHLAGNATLRASLGREGRSRALGFSHTRHLTEVQSLYDGVIRTRGA
jgi:glycosyltransferase involved in cell wall biosynthesis